MFLQYQMLIFFNAYMDCNCCERDQNIIWCRSASGSVMNIIRLFTQLLEKACTMAQNDSCRAMNIFPMPKHFAWCTSCKMFRHGEHAYHFSASIIFGKRSLQISHQMALLYYPPCPLSIQYENEPHTILGVTELKGQDLTPKMATIMACPGQLSNCNRKRQDSMILSAEICYSLTALYSSLSDGLVYDHHGNINQW